MYVYGTLSHRICETRVTLKHEYAYFILHVECRPFAIRVDRHFGLHVSMCDHGMVYTYRSTKCILMQTIHGLYVFGLHVSCAERTFKVSSIGRYVELVYASTWAMPL